MRATEVLEENNLDQAGSVSPTMEEMEGIEGIGAGRSGFLNGSSRIPVMPTVRAHTHALASGPSPRQSDGAERDGMKWEVKAARGGEGTRGMFWNLR